MCHRLAFQRRNKREQALLRGSSIGLASSALPLAFAHAAWGIAGLQYAALVTLANFLTGELQCGADDCEHCASASQPSAPNGINGSFLLLHAVHLGSYLFFGSAGAAFPERFEHTDGGIYRCNRLPIIS